MSLHSNYLVFIFYDLFVYIDKVVGVPVARARVTGNVGFTHIASIIKRIAYGLFFLFFAVDFHFFHNAKIRCTIIAIS